MNRFLTLPLLILFFNTLGQSKFTPNPAANYFQQRDFWDHHFDSLKNDLIGQGLSDNIEGFTSYMRWRNFWESYMPASGSYSEALEIMELSQRHLEYRLLESYSGTPAPIPSYLLLNAVEWTELGPNKVSAIKSEHNTANGAPANWFDSHMNNNGLNPQYDHNNGGLQSGAHVAKIDRLYQHPTNSNILYAMAGAIENGGGAFVSFDFGANWSLLGKYASGDLGTDQIPNANINAFAIKPSDVAPDIGIEYLFIGLATGAIYRSVDEGRTWFECNYNGNHNYPFNFYWIPNGGYVNSNSLPYNHISQNFSYSITEMNNDIKFTKKDATSNEYSRLVVCRDEGLFFSNNYNTSLSASGAQIQNNIIWSNFANSGNFNTLFNSIPVFYSTPTDVIYRTHHFTDFEWAEKNGQTYYFAQFEVAEIGEKGDNDANVNTDTLGNIRQYVIQSTDFGVNWSFVGGNINDPNGAHKQEVATGKNSYARANIEVLKLNPTYIYIATDVATSLQYNLHRYNLDDPLVGWENLYQGNIYNPIGTNGHAFAIDPNNEENWWLMPNGIHRMLNGNFLSLANSSNYSRNFHADGRDVLITDNGTLFLGTDGGVYKGDIVNNDVILNASSEGINAAQSHHIALAQKEPFYVASGFWHAGMQIYNPTQNIWHYGSLQDGTFGSVFFLNNERFSLGSQSFTISVISDFSKFDKLIVGGLLASSENISGRSYGTLRSGSNDILGYNNDDFTNTTSLSLTGLTYPKYKPVPYTIPNEPDLLMVAVVNGNSSTLNFYNGCADGTPLPNLYKSVDLFTVYQNLGGDDGVQLGKVVFDHRKNGVFWMVLHGGPDYNSNKARIVEYDPLTDSYIDLSFPIDDDFQISNSFPNWMSISGLTLDRQTGILYLGTRHGVYYLDRAGSKWRKYSNNVPLFETSIDIRHCTGEIFASSLNRGIWFADLIRNSNNPTLEWNITSSQTWEGRVNLFCNLIIESGTTLIVKDEIVVYGDQKIIIKPGGNLILDGAIITTECGDFWTGIEVWGTSDERQLSTYQGTLTMMNGATIENAFDAVRLWKPDDWSSTGGIIRATNAIFHNNRRDVEFMPYQGVHFGINEANQSYFHYCQFITDDDFLRETPAPHVTMYMVNGVRFLACDFVDERDVEKERKSSGIYTIDAKFKVLSQYTGTASIPNDYYQEQDFINSTFTNLQHGVWASNANSQNTVTIDRALFTNCEIGVELAQVDNAIVSRNKFLRDDNLTTSDWYDYQHSVYLNTSSAFFVEGNIFESNNADSKMVGVTSYNTGLENNEIRRNKYLDVAVGNYAFGKNKNMPSPSETFKGLEYLCNKHGDNELYDVLVFGLQASDGVKRKQGVLAKPTGIAWSEPISGITLQASSNITQNTEFFYSTNSSDEELTLYSTNTIVPVEITPTNSCESHFSILKPRPTRPIDGGTASMLILLQDSLDNEISGNMERYLGFVQDGDREELYDLLSSMDENNAASIKNTLLAESPFLSKELLMELARYCPDPFTYSWFLDVVFANIEIAKDEDFISFISNKPYAIPENMIDSLVQEALTGRTQKSDLLEEIMLMEAQRNNLINYRIKDDAHDTIPILAQQLDSLILQRNDFNKFIQLSDLFLMNKDKTNAERWLDSLDVLASNSLSPNREELNDYSAFKREMLLATNNDGYLEGLDSLTEAFIRTHLQTAGGISQVQAQNLLCFFFNECAEPPTVAIEKSITINNNLPFDEITSFTSSEISVYPNPARNAVVISLKEAETPIQVTFTNVKGEIVKRETMHEKHAEIDIRDLSDGLYTITLEDKSGKLYSGKLLKQ